MPLVSHDAVVEAAVIGKPHKTAGEMIKAFVILKQGQSETPDMIKHLQDHVLKELGKIAVPKEVEIVTSLPKTRSGKIMRRVLKAKRSLVKTLVIFRPWKNNNSTIHLID